MATPLVFSLCLLSLFLVSLAEIQLPQHRLRAKASCQIQQLVAREPTRRFDYEAGSVELYDSDNQEFECAAVDFVRHTIQPKGLLLPNYANSHRLVYIIQGRGILGAVIPGCAETYESGSERKQGEERRSDADRHQKLRRFQQGDVLALQSGITHWTYNDGDTPIISVSIRDVGNEANQLDLKYRDFFLAGKPQPSQGQKQQEKRNILSGFATEFLAEAFNNDPKTVRKIQGNDDNRGAIVRADNLKLVFPEFGQQEQEREQEQGQQEQEQGQQEQEREARKEQEREARKEQEREARKEQEREGESEQEREARKEQEREARKEQEREARKEQEREARKEQEREARKEQEREGESEREREARKEQEREARKEQESEQEREAQKEQEREGESKQEREARKEQEREQGQQEQEGSSESNGLEETVCTYRIRQNIDNPRKADLFNPRAGRITRLNSQKLPILSNLRLNADRGILYKNAVMAPHWSVNSHTLLYVTRGSARIQVVGNQGNTVFDDEAREGQLLVVPQNFAVVKRANEEGFEWVAFRTNDNAMIGQLAGRLSAIRAMPEEVVMNAYGVSREEARSLKYSREEATLLSPASSSASA